MNPDTKRGMEFMRVVVKSALFALFAIGVKSTENIEKFVAAFEKALDRGLESSGFTPTIEKPQQTILPTSAKRYEVKKPVDLKEVITSNIMRSVLNKNDIHTVDDLIKEMQKHNLTAIHGIGARSADVIGKALQKWQSLS